MEKLTIICGILSSILILWQAQLSARWMPRKEILDKFKGKKTSGNAEINGFNHHVTFIVGDGQLGLKSSVPDIGIILNLDDLQLKKKKSFIGSRIKITSSDVYLEHFLEVIIISHRVARIIDQLSDGQFGYEKI